MYMYPGMFAIYYSLFCSVGSYLVSHNYGNPYERWNIFVYRPLLWLQLGTVKPEIMLCETVLNLFTLNTLTYLLTYLLISWRNGSAHYWCSNQTVAYVFVHALKPKADTLNRFRAVWLLDNTYVLNFITLCLLIQKLYNKNQGFP